MKLVIQSGDIKREIEAPFALCGSRADYYWSDTILEVGLAGEEDTQNLRDYIFLAGPLEPPKE